jgi:hypothetical protein
LRASPNPIPFLAWYRPLLAEKFDGCKRHRSPGRPRTSPEIEDLVVRLARENSGWGYDRMVGALANLGYQVSDQTVGNILRRHGLGPVFGKQQNDYLEGTLFAGTWTFSPAPISSRSRC